MAATPTEPDHPVTTRVIDMNAEVRKIWGARWNEPEVVYEFSNGRKFVAQPGDDYRSA